MILFLCIIVILAAAFSAGLYAYTCLSLKAKRQIPGEYRLSGSMARYEAEYGETLKKLQAEPFEQVSTLSEDGLRLQARYYHLRDDAPFAILMHGYRVNSFCDFLKGYFMMKDLGYNLLLIDERGCGLSEGNAISFGVMERRDCLCWVNYLKERFGQDIPVALYGVSMGAATVMMASGMEDTPANIRAVIADCGYTSPKDIIREVASSMKLPADLCYPFCRFGAKVLGGFDLNAASALEAVRKTKIPMLFIHGEKDDFVPFAMCGRLYTACASEKELLTVPEAVHANSILVDYETYASRVEAFLNKTVN